MPALLRDSAKVCGVWGRVTCVWLRVLGTARSFLLHLQVINSFSTDVSDWECGDVCWWIGELGLKEYDVMIRSNDITGKVLLDLQTKDLQVS